MTNINRKFKFNHHRSSLSAALGLDQDYISSMLSVNIELFSGLFNNGKCGSEIVEELHNFLHDDSVPSIDKTIMIFLTFDAMMTKQINHADFSVLDTKEFIDQIRGVS